MIKINSLSKEYKLRKGQTVNALKGVSLTLPNTGLIFILGKSGSGKSTFLNLLGGLDRPTDGEIIVDGKSSKNFTENDFNAYRNEYVGFIFQEYNLIEQYSIGSNIALSLELQNGNAARDDIEELLRELDLIDESGNTLYDRSINELSGGQKQRVAIARALIKKPKLILADEPTGALDSETGKNLYALLKKFSSERLIIIVTHDRESAELYGDRIVELKDGTLNSDTVIQAKEPDIAFNKKDGNSLCDFKSQGKLPFKRILTMGLSGLRYKKFRLALSIMLAVISFTIFGFTVVAGNVNTLTTELNAAYKCGNMMIVLEGNSTYKSSVIYDDNRFPPYNTEGNHATLLVEEQICSLENYSVYMPVYRKDTVKFDTYGYLARGREDLSLAEIYNPYNYLGLRLISNLVELDPKTGEVDALLTPDRRLTKQCRLPQNFNEIAITDFHADMFMRFGFKDMDGDDTVYEIKAPDELIGKSLGGLTICGIYQTEEDKEWFKDNYDFDNYSIAPGTELYSSDFFLKSIDDYIYPWLKGEHIMTYGFVCRGFYEHFNGREEKIRLSNVLFKLSGDIAKDKEILDELSFEEHREFQGAHCVTYQTNYYSAKIRTRLSGFVDAVDFINEDIVIETAFIISVIFAIFSALLMTNFLLAGLDLRKKEMGILRALGARKLDVVLICLVESIFIALINFILSLTVIGIICLIINIKIYLPLFGIGIMPFFAVMLLCLGVSVLSIVLPSVKIMRNKPIEIITKM